MLPDIVEVPPASPRRYSKYRRFSSHMSPRRDMWSRSLSGVCGFVFARSKRFRAEDRSFLSEASRFTGCLDPNVSVRRIEAPSLVSDVLAVPSLEVYVFSWSVSCVCYVYCGVIVIRCYVFNFRQLVLWQSSFSLVIRGFAQTQCLSSSCTVKAYFNDAVLTLVLCFFPVVEPGMFGIMAAMDQEAGLMVLTLSLTLLLLVSQASCTTCTIPWECNSGKSCSRPSLCYARCCWCPGSAQRCPWRHF